MTKKRDLAEPTKDKSNSSKASRSWIFGIGINDYDQFEPLNNAVRDVKEIQAIMQEKYDVNQVITLFNEEAYGSNILQHFEKLVIGELYRINELKSVGHSLRCIKI